ncbi:MAG: hypothetical protein MRT15_01985 [archaeon YNP-LCB-003-016]|jgi:V-type H+-transporting ATPase proteolipid subunit|uniref:hypothetical protein n=1 Tax=Candidatus Culexarchaeum yellowstonense TaxID=2928963 RepID=UPI0026F2D9B5|nr:hypothetical protein [Candidatus Culexarchaeum yellowstonense]MCR6669022.1 hypothetical protein [Candidatus Culexarchaeum yellowstonense]MCR6691139.1 hypothetical protein [Candidatus Culexarchaeum yellowstonense]
MDQVITGLLGVLLSSCVPIAGAAYGIITAGISMAGAGTERPEIVTRLLLAVVLAEAIGIYGLLTSIMLIGKLSTILASYEASMKGLTAGAVMAACGLMASIAIAYTGSAMAGAGVEKPEIVTRTLLAVVLAEALAIYGLLISIMLIGTI